MKDADAINSLGIYYATEAYGFPQNYNKAFELWHQAGELGSAAAYNNIAAAYRNDNEVEKDEKKAIHYCELAAMGGCVEARHNLGNIELGKGNADRGFKHYTVAIPTWWKQSLFTESQKALFKWICNKG